MQCHKTAGALLESLLDEGKKNLRLHPYDIGRLEKTMVFLDAFERLDSPIFCAMVEALRSDGRQAFCKAFLELREVL